MISAEIRELGFCPRQNIESCWVIEPLTPQENWCLKFQSERWILYVDEIAQISFYPDEVKWFLRKRVFPHSPFLKYPRLQINLPPEQKIVGHGIAREA